MNPSYKILILGASGMLGSAIFRILSESSHNVFGTIRNSEFLRFFSREDGNRLFSSVDVLNQDDLIDVFTRIKPDIVINCIGLIKQQKSAKDPLTVLPINSILPHRLSNLCKMIGARLILMSTDCVFNGKKGFYSEVDISDAEDLYGKSKEIGEIANEPHVFTIRTSIIGHELNSNHSLINWFLSQETEVKGYKKAIFSGFPTSEIAEILKNVVIPRTDLYGLYHISSNPISKLDLLTLVADVYGKKIRILESDEVVIDRSLDSQKFRKETGFVPKEWKLLVQDMKSYRDKYLESNYV
ncbi:dTDP-4-dehydrorhamnose reductase family protein [Leptospira kmetyi]|uniref:dTDP-4-dehydrorhamnose reductase family protein n=1 Tax=Leptospira kmetyi TaxID=408139 RepID=UPI0010848E3A|nr:SDR family oxidoreductase [Leptospira kmetyi]TGK21407.1 SDR family oxidoreductase [Leptospira kmetyi]TGK28334.1 SDR family oxidoreductase [Leptospira kmetyi]TGL68298.1 SDR family oxidoreductase [Leptospira kmetyi]